MVVFDLLLPFVLSGLHPTGSNDMIPMDIPLTQAGFELIDHEQGVHVYKHTHSQLIHIAAEGFFQANVDQVQQVLLDYERHVGKVERVSECRIMRRSRDSLLVYQRLNLPVISDRDYFLTVHWGERNGVHWIHYFTNKKRQKPRSGIVRVTRHRGSWQLRSTTKGTLARYQSQIDMAGMLPLWLARSGACDEVSGLFVAIRSML